MTITSSTPDTFLFANLQQDARHQRLAAAQATVIDGRLNDISRTGFHIA